MAALPPRGQLTPEGDIGQLAAAYEFLGCFLWGSASEHSLDQGIIRHILLPVSQRVSEPRLLEFGVDRRFGIELKLERLKGRVAILLEPLRIGLGLLLSQPNEVPRDREELGIKRETARQEVVALEDLGVDLLGLADAIPGCAIGFFFLGVDVDPRPHFLLRLGLAGHERGVAQAAQAADPRLAAVLNTEQLFLRVPSGLWTGLAVFEQEGLLVLEVVQRALAR